MSPFLIGVLALGVAVLGVVAHAVRFAQTRTFSFAATWVVVPFLAAMVAFLMTPPTLLTVGLGSATVGLALVSLAASVVVPALVGDERERKRAE